MIVQKVVKTFTLIIVFVLLLSQVIYAGTYTVTENVSGGFAEPNVTVTNSSGSNMTGAPYRFSATKTNVSSISGSVRIDTLTSGTSISMQVLYSTNGTNFYAGTTFNCPIGVKVPYTISFGTSTKSIVALFVLPSTKTWSYYSLSFWHPTVVRTLTDNIAPTITATASTEWDTSNTITVNITDGHSGVLRKKWTRGIASVDYFASSGTTFYGSTISVSSNGMYSIYAIDNAGNAIVKTVTVSYVDNYISITHPISVGYNINPNNVNPFSAADISLKNNSRIKVKVSVQEFKATSGGSLTFSDVLPTTFSNWTTLNKSQTKSYIALGLQVKEASTSSTTWYSIMTDPVYAVNITSDTYFGILNPNSATGNLKILGKCGLAWDDYYTTRHNINFLFETY